MISLLHTLFDKQNLDNFWLVVVSCKIQGDDWDGGYNPSILCHHKLLVSNSI